MTATADCPPRPADAAWTEPELLQKLEPIYLAQLAKLELVDPKILNTSYDLARLRARMLEEGDLNPALRVYAIVNDRYARSKPDEILVSAPALLCLLDPDTMVLLTDGITHHYAFIERIDWATRTARIADAWARDSFLIGPDLPEGVRGRLEKKPSGAVTIVVPLETLTSFLVGALVTDNESFAGRVAAVHTLAHDPDDSIALGLSVATRRDPGSFSRALPYFQRALVAAPSDLTKQQARVELAYMCVIGVLAQLEGGSRVDLDRFSGMLRGMLEKGEVSFDEIPAAQLTRIGEQYFTIAQMPNGRFHSLLGEAENYLSLAIKRDPSYADAFLARAQTRFEAHQVDLALADADEANRLYTAQIRQVIHTPGSDFVDQFYGYSSEISIVAEIKSRRWRLLNLLAAIYANKGMGKERLAASEEATRLAPMDPTGWALVAEARKTLGDTHDALQAAKQALGLATDAGERSAIKERLSGILSTAR